MVFSGFGRSAKNYGLTYVGVVWYAITKKQIRWFPSTTSSWLTK